MAFRDPYRVLGVDPAATPSAIKAAWRRLAREHHPDLASDEVAREEATRRMAEINAAYEELRSSGLRAGAPGRANAAHGWPPGSSRAHPEAGTGSAAYGSWGTDDEPPPGPPPEPTPPPVTARFDTSNLFRPRNQTTTPEGGGFRHHPRPRAAPLRARVTEREARRASDPNGPLERERPRRPPYRERPSIAVARTTEIAFGKFGGWTLGAIAVVEPTYLEWIVRTVTRDPDLVAAVRVVLADVGRPVGDAERRPQAE